MFAKLKSKNFYFNHGFTLVEMLVVIAIVGIIAAVVYPSYTSHIVNARRVDAQNYLLEQANLLERQYAAKGSYPCDSCFDVKSSDFYVFKYKRNAADQFLLEAIPGTRQKDSRCGTLGLTQTGAQSAASAGCWRE